MGVPLLAPAFMPPISPPFPFSANPAERRPPFSRGHRARAFTIPVQPHRPAMGVPLLAPAFMPPISPPTPPSAAPSPFSRGHRARAFTAPHLAAGIVPARSPPPQPNMLAGGFNPPPPPSPNLPHRPTIGVPPTRTQHPPTASTPISSPN